MTSFDFGVPIDMPHKSLRAVLIATVSALSRQGSRHRRSLPAALPQLLHGPVSRGVRGNNVNGARAFQYDCLDRAEDQLWFYDLA